MRVIDLRSDTVTMPSAEMREAMATAPLGDDVFGDDPTANRLAEVAADRMGKEAAMFVASGTMGNLIGIAVNAGRGEELIADADSHVFYYETAGAAAVCGVQIRPVPTRAGVMSPGQIVDVIRPRDDTHQPYTAAVTFENTHNRHGGVVWPLDDLRAASDAAHANGLRVHLDGARIFNAVVALGVEAREIAACADTVTFCLSKGLGCPIGSVFCGSGETVDEARRWRKRLGGGMRQVGVLASAGLYALDHMVDRLAEDHSNARTLAEGLAEMRGVRCDLDRVQTNLVYFDLEAMPPPAFTEACTSRGLLSESMGPRTMRFVTHYGIEAQDIQSALSICEDVLSA
ncbi:MAG TPA: GntG family PLP-dependent aldolase [Candidatus Dormibacteraeota bacterium]|nr:GntG family PLP-dependent aldolase [Candidatus Dormibacteraeota bacterium]